MQAIVTQRSTDEDVRRLWDMTTGAAARLMRKADYGIAVGNPADLVVLPGSKSVAADLAWLRGQGWEDYLARHLRYGGKLVGGIRVRAPRGQAAQRPPVAKPAAAQLPQDEDDIPF